jgi:signal transduction histidine kinase
LGAELRLFRSLHPEDKDDVERAIARARETGTYEADYRIVRPDDSLVWVTERGRVVPDADGNPTRVVGISRDVTGEREAARDRERLLEEARQATDEAEHQSRLKDEFLATLSHELRTPMNVILGWLTILDRRKPLRDISSAIAVIRRNAEHEAKLIEDMLDMTRLMAGAVRLEMSDLDLGALVEATVQGLQPAADDKKVRVSASVEPGIGDVPADAKRLQQVLWNLVQNALKFTASGGSVDIRAWRVNGNVRIAVQDTGQGIAPEFLPHVFERFRQQDASMAKEAYGLGLGLSIAKLLVELHGGSIEASSPGVGQGATFTIELPAAATATVGTGGDAHSRRRHEAEN